MSNEPNGAFSADVRLSLRIDNTDFPLHKVSPTRAVMRKAADLPVGDAELIVSVDGKSQVSRVRLPVGASVLSATVEIETA